MVETETETSRAVQTGKKMRSLALRIRTASQLAMAVFLLSPRQLDSVSCFQMVPADRHRRRPAATTAPTTTTASCRETTSSALHMGKQRQTKRKKKVDKSRPEQFFDAINEAKGEGKPKKAGEKETPADPERQARMEDAQRRMDERPDVSTMIVDDETGIEVVAQGKAVMDVVTRKAVKLYDDPDYRLAQMFPGVPPDVREKYRFDWTSVEVPEMVEKLREACRVKMADGSREIPPHPSVASKAIDFVLANRDRLGYKMKRTLGRLYLSSLSDGNKQEALGYQKLWKNFLTLENHISAPFRQMIMDGEGRVGPNFGNLDVKSYCDGDLYARCANYLVLKGMVAHWEKKVVDADYLEKTPQTKENYMTVLSRGDPKRYLPDPPILFTLRECTQVCLMAQQMTKAFVETPELFDDLPPEVRFLEAALSIQGGAPLRRFVVEEFCPMEGITPEALREGMRRLLVQFENMQLDPYGDITNLIDRLCAAAALGTDDERDPYVAYLASRDKDAPGSFQTYTFDAEPLSRVRFLDSQYERAGAKEKQPRSVPVGGGGFFNFGGDQAAAAPEPKLPAKEASSGERYKVPQVRALGRPHELGWLDLLKEEKEAEEQRLGRVPAGQILVEEE